MMDLDSAPDSPSFRGYLGGGGVSGCYAFRCGTPTAATAGAPALASAAATPGAQEQHRAAGGVPVGPGPQPAAPPFRGWLPTSQPPAARPERPAATAAAFGAAHASPRPHSDPYMPQPPPPLPPAVWAGSVVLAVGPAGLRPAAATAAAPDPMAPGPPPLVLPGPPGPHPPPPLNPYGSGDLLMSQEAQRELQDAPVREQLLAEIEALPWPRGTWTDGAALLARASAPELGPASQHHPSAPHSLGALHHPGMSQSSSDGALSLCVKCGEYDSSALTSGPEGASPASPVSPVAAAAVRRSCTAPEAGALATAGAACAVLARAAPSKRTLCSAEGERWGTKGQPGSPMEAAEGARSGTQGPQQSAAGPGPACAGPRGEACQVARDEAAQEGQRESGCIPPEPVSPRAVSQPGPPAVAGGATASIASGAAAASGRERRGRVSSSKGGAAEGSVSAVTAGCGQGQSAHAGPATSASGSGTAAGGRRGATEGGEAGTDLQALARVFDLKAEDAARALGLTPNELKRRCRAMGIQRWPQRKLMSLRRIAEAAQADGALPAEERQASNQWESAVLGRVAANRAAILADPDAPLHPALTALRQAQYKQEFEVRRAGGGGGGGGGRGRPLEPMDEDG
ncbi:hypothetical protein HYH03_003807 [Edaphochlamys debaryana]|uniref:RWP-RK domain-containing protein n=1 Tax=Edaphochlamys debaryana TaxID=47281 RepID=A0A835Y8M9_9CHLO|nr:hypothetical protein HYH03_003807 [Edaphochlamys debaryana]|eukprot:KAG2498046.1 hypothetical protein HYH03_003807 [Edaphochlamys debaryana]